MTDKMWCGIDYGSKLAGTTCICYPDENGMLQIFQSRKKEDADAFLASHLERVRFDFVMIDAPLSLPKAYHDVRCTDFLFRKADRELRAMSPMFLGGLTARAMQLRRKYLHMNFIETYPAALISRLELKHLYQKSSGGVEESLVAQLFNGTAVLGSRVNNYHQLDSLIAWVSGLRLTRNENVFIGDDAEGLICL